MRVSSTLIMGLGQTYVHAGRSGAVLASLATAQVRSFNGLKAGQELR